MSDLETDFREQFLDIFSKADYPVTSQMDLMPALPNGPGTKFTVGDTTITAMELATKAAGHQDFPYDSAEDLVDDLMTGLREENVF